MGVRYRKSVKLAPGVKVNVGKKSIGFSVGNKYGGVSVNSRSGVRTRISAPGTGLSYTASPAKSTNNSLASDLQSAEPIDMSRINRVACRLLVILGPLMIIAGLLLALVYPIFGVAGAMFGLVSLLIGIYYPKKK